ncbi:PrgI family protein [Glycomyces tenuis]|uniref:PrgI family protein n=1 Tax=Glycomyces tenuis TaxID=58116 RepID=UPI0003F4D3A8|nr:PrgI family protein [Glycomyces tenuis]
MTRSVPVPADIDLADRVLWGLTVRQVAVLAPVALGLLAAWRSLLGTVPILVLLIATAPIASSALALALVKVDAVGLDRLAWAAVRGTRGRVAAGAPTPEARSVLAAIFGRSGRGEVRPVTGPVRRVRTDGVVDLGSAGSSIGIDVGFVNFTLRSSAEQAALVGAFARLLNSVDAHIQVQVTSRPVDLSGHLQAQVERTARLADPRLAAAAAAHTAWLGRLTTGRRLLRREITVVARASRAEAAEYAARQVEAAAQAMGVIATRLDAAELTARCRYAIDPYGTASARIARKEQSS